MVSIDEDVVEVLKAAVVEGNQLTLPGHRLSPDLYKKVNKVLELAGGKWTRKVAAHVFPSDPREALGIAMESGKIEDRKQTLQAFYTPPDLARRMVMHLGDLRGKNCLEPSAGHGAIALAMREAGGTPYCVEIDAKSRDVLVTKGFSCVLCDFMWWDNELRYHAIAMNPPFTRGQDVAHVARAFDMLAPGGRLVAIISGGARTGQSKTHKAFAAIVEANGRAEPIDSGAFAESGTNVRTELLILDKPCFADAMLEARKGRAEV